MTLVSRKGPLSTRTGTMCLRTSFALPNLMCSRARLPPSRLSTHQPTLIASGLLDRNTASTTFLSSMLSRTQAPATTSAHTPCSCRALCRRAHSLSTANTSKFRLPTQLMLATPRCGSALSGIRLLLSSTSACTFSSRSPARRKKLLAAGSDGSSRADYLPLLPVALTCFSRESTPASRSATSGWLIFKKSSYSHSFGVLWAQIAPTRLTDHSSRCRT